MSLVNSGIKDVPFYSATKWSRWAMPGMDSPCWDVVGDISAPVATNKRLRISRFSNFPKRYPHKTAAEQPQPEPPA